MSPALRPVLAITAGITIAAGARPAAADPRVDLDRCVALDRVELRRAVEAELAGLSPGRRAAADARVVVVECPDAVTAHLRLEPAPATGAMARSLDLGDVPGDMRARLIALAVVEVVSIAALIDAPGPASGPAAGHPTTAVEPTPVTGPGPEHASGLDPVSMGDRPPAGAAPAPTHGGGGGAVATRVAAAPLVSRRALGEGPILAGRSLEARAGVRIYPARAVPMLAVAVEVTQGVVTIGLGAAIGQTDDPLGRVRPYLVTAGGGITVACARRGALEACASGRISAGLAAATASSTDPAVSASDAIAPYFELGGQLELAWRGRRRAGIVTLDAGWAEGLIAAAGPRDAARLDGAAVAAAIGVRW